MNDADILHLVVAHSLYNKGKTMETILNETFHQTREYVTSLQQDSQIPQTEYYIYSCLAVGSAKILYKKQKVT
jgi:hypothetical protein